MMIQSGTDPFVFPEERNRKTDLFYSIHVTTIDDRSFKDCGGHHEEDGCYFQRAFSHTLPHLKCSIVSEFQAR